MAVFISLIIDSWPIGKITDQILANAGSPANVPFQMNAFSPPSEEYRLPGRARAGEDWGPVP